MGGRSGIRLWLGGWGDKMGVRMREGLGLEVWDHPEERRRVVGEALARWDEALLKEALWAYLVRHRKKPDRAAPTTWATSSAGSP